MKVLTLEQMNKTCTKCSEQKPIKEFYLRKDSGKYRNECKRCIKKAQAKRTYKNPVRKKLKQAHIDSIRRARHYKVYFEDFSVRELAKIIELQDYKCSLCHINIKDNFQIDHIKPISKNGGHYPDNIQFLCASCNSTKEERPRDKLGKFKPLTPSS
jgi:5-methylcytosine-specific restriction endonuclease McrA